MVGEIALPLFKEKKNTLKEPSKEFENNRSNKNSKRYSIQLLFNFLMINFHELQIMHSKAHTRSITNGHLIIIDVNSKEKILSRSTNGHRFSEQLN